MRGSRGLSSSQRLHLAVIDDALLRFDLDASHEGDAIAAFLSNPSGRADEGQTGPPVAFLFAAHCGVRDEFCSTSAAWGFSELWASFGDLDRGDL